MPEHELQGFEAYLRRAGIQSRYARRAMLELSDHMADIETTAVAAGMSQEEARAESLRRIGSLRIIADQIVSCRQLRTWPYRHPRLARLWYPLAYVTLLPARPLLAGVERAPTIARWLACGVLGAAVTASMMLILQLSILFA